MDTDFDFQDWAQLASASPGAFEARRKATIEAFLAGSSDAQGRLGRNLQREIDFEIGRAGSPEQAMGAIAKMVRGQMDFLCEQLGSLNRSLLEFESLALKPAKPMAEALAPAEAQPSGLRGG